MEPASDPAVETRNPIQDFLTFLIGAVLQERTTSREGRQGERLQLLVESEDPRVSRVELSTLRARVVEDGS